MSVVARDRARDRRRRIAGFFGAAAATYDAHAAVQRRVAERLAARLDGLPPPARALEVGCGTGLLSARLAARWPDSGFLFTDLAPAMLARCRARLAGHAARAAFAVMDGEAPAVAPVFDLVAASLVLQWFADPGGGLARLAACLAPGGTLAFATLGRGTFGEWRAAHADLGLSAGVPDFPSAAGLDALWPAGGDGAVAEERIPRRYADPHDFLRELRAVGAHLPAPGHRPLSPGALRAVLRRLGPEFSVTYSVLYGRFRRHG